MHYKNGREAKEGDSVICKSTDGTNRVVAGTVHSLNAGAETCNGQVAVAVVGGVFNNYVTLSEVIHVEDALSAMDEKQS